MKKNTNSSLISFSPVMAEGRATYTQLKLAATHVCEFFCRVIAPPVEVIDGIAMGG